jgi:hypothetical protein
MQSPTHCHLNPSSLLARRQETESRRRFESEDRDEREMILTKLMNGMSRKNVITRRCAHRPG